MLSITRVARLSFACHHRSAEWWNGHLSKTRHALHHKYQEWQPICQFSKLVWFLKNCHKELTVLNVLVLDSRLRCWKNFEILSVICMNHHGIYTVQKFGVSKIYVFLKKWILLFCKDTLNWWNATVKTFYNVTKDFYFKLMLFFWPNNPEKSIMVSTKI